MLQRLFEQESTVRACYLLEVQDGDDHTENLQSLTVWALMAFQERIRQLAPRHLVISEIRTESHASS